MDEEREIGKNVGARQMARTLRRIANTIERNEGFVIQISNERIRVPATAIISIVYECEDGNNELEFQFTWE